MYKSLTTYREKAEKSKVDPPDTRKRLKLPTLTIKEFRGDPKEYTSFKDAFNVAVEGVDSISDIEKFTYLKRFLKSDADAAIRGLALTKANYKEAWEILILRFGSKQVIINSHMDALIKIPPVTKMDETIEIRVMYDEIEVNLRSLKAIV